MVKTAVAETGSICTRCGKQRVVIGTHEEVIGISTVVFTDTACPDKICQAEVEGKLEKEQQKREKFRKFS